MKQDYFNFTELTHFRSKCTDTLGIFFYTNSCTFNHLLLGHSVPYVRLMSDTDVWKNYGGFMSDFFKREFIKSVKNLR